MCQMRKILDGHKKSQKTDVVCCSWKYDTEQTEVSSLLKQAFARRTYSLWYGDWSEKYHHIPLTDHF